MREPDTDRIPVPIVEGLDDNAGNTAGFYPQSPIWMAGGFVLTRAYIYPDYGIDHIVLLYFSKKQNINRRIFLNKNGTYRTMDYPGNYRISSWGLIGYAPGETMRERAKDRVNPANHRRHTP